MSAGVKSGEYGERGSARSCDFSRKNLELTGKCVPEHCRVGETVSFSSALFYQDFMT